MIIVGTQVSEGKIKVDGCFIDGSNVATIDAINPPNPPEAQFGKEPVLFLDTTTNTLYWEFVDRTLTEAETIEKLKTDNVLMQQAIDDLILGGAL